MRIFFKRLTVFLAAFLEIIFAFCVYFYYATPNSYRITESCGLNIDTKLPVKAAILQKDKQVLNSNFMDLKKNNYKANIVFLNAIPVKNVNLEVIKEQKVIPCGEPFGVKIFTKGVVIIGISDVKTVDGVENPAKKIGLKKGDIILKVNQEEIKNNDQLIDFVQQNNDKELNFEVLRGNFLFEVKIKPIKGDDNLYHLGIWVRDSSAGIGTLTFFNKENNTFAGLGHGICDIDTGELLPLSHGEIVKASINGIVKGKKGMPGELKGYFIESDPIGELFNNTQCGVFGKLNEALSDKDAIPVAMKQQVKIGKAKILATIEGISPDYYDINIESINYNEHQPSKNMIIKITDERLLEKTGGIIQGMSGSPIIQNDMLVGAVTHVFVNDPQKGYGIFSENMIATNNDDYMEYKKSS